MSFTNHVGTSYILDISDCEKIPNCNSSHILTTISSEYLLVPPADFLKPVSYACFKLCECVHHSKLEQWLFSLFPSI